MFLLLQTLLQCTGETKTLVIIFSFFATSPAPSSKHVHACISEFIKISMHNFHFEQQQAFIPTVFSWFHVLNCVCELYFQKKVYDHKMKLFLCLFHHVVLSAIRAHLKFSKTKANFMHNLKQENAKLKHSILQNLGKLWNFSHITFFSIWVAFL